jgi:hypothetical protein
MLKTHISNKCLYYGPIFTIFFPFFFYYSYVHTRLKGERIYFGSLFQRFPSIVSGNVAVCLVEGCDEAQLPTSW